MSDDKFLAVGSVKTADDLLDENQNASFFWKKIFADADKMGASDLHINKLPKRILIRARVYGEMQILLDAQESDSVVQSYIGRLKQLAKFDLSTFSKAQDRAFSLSLTKSRYRVALSPADHGEYIVLRIIKENDIPNICTLGLEQGLLDGMLEASKKSQGFIVVTGPTGSGKSTTLQGLIMSMDREKKNVISIEDPIERRLPGITQQQITSDFNWTDAIRTAMRQDPDIIFIGEIRDRESAKLAFEAASTGHLVISTLHTNGVVESIERLLGLGVERQVIADNFLLATAQRLTQKLCPHCRLLVSHQRGLGDFYERNNLGCLHCNKKNGLGIIGRQILAEYIYAPNRDDILEFNKDALKNSMKYTLEKDALGNALLGNISLESYQSFTSTKEVICQNTTLPLLKINQKNGQQFTHLH